MLAAHKGACGAGFSWTGIGEVFWPSSSSLEICGTNCNKGFWHRMAKILSLLSLDDRLATRSIDPKHCYRIYGVQYYALLCFIVWSVSELQDSSHFLSKARPKHLTPSNAGGKPQC